MIIIYLNTNNVANFLYTEKKKNFMSLQFYTAERAEIFRAKTHAKYELKI